MDWQINKIQYPIYNLGQGKRIGIWVQGCSLMCTGCINQTIRDKNGGKSIDLRELFNWIVLKSEAFDGITITGGEPFEQYEQLIAFLHLIKTKTNLNVCCYTGYYLHELYGLHKDKLFSHYVDYLIDGRYVIKYHEDDNTKGSTNQSVYRFINRIPYYDETFAFDNKWSLKVTPESKIYMAGIPRSGEIEKICSDLKEQGVHKIFR